MFFLIPERSVMVHVGAREYAPRPPAIGDHVRLDAPQRQDLNGNSPMILKAIDEATGIVTLTRQCIELTPEIPIYLNNLVKVDPPFDASAPVEPPVEPEPIP